MFRLDGRRAEAARKAADALRADVAVEDFALIFEQLAAIQGPTATRTAALRRRYLALILQALQTTNPVPLPWPPPTEAEMAERWTASRQMRDDPPLVWIQRPSWPEVCARRLAPERSGVAL